jgi:hypothetical protein
MNEQVTDTTIKFPNNEPFTTVNTQHGMRFPDGTHVWETMNVGGGRYVTFSALAKPERGTNGRYWEEYLDRAAANANVDKEGYAKSHQLVKRTVIVVATGSEDAHVEAPAGTAVPWEL